MLENRHLSLEVSVNRAVDICVEILHDWGRTVRELRLDRPGRNLDVVQRVPGDEQVAIAVTPRSRTGCTLTIGASTTQYGSDLADEVKLRVQALIDEAEVRANPSSEAERLYNLGWERLEAGQIRQGEQALRAGVACGDTEWSAACQYVLGEVFVHVEDIPQAQRELALAADLQHPKWSMAAANLLGDIAIARDGMEGYARDLWRTVEARGLPDEAAVARERLREFFGSS